MAFNSSANFQVLTMYLLQLNQVKALRSKAKTLQGQVQLQHSAHQLWSSISDTDWLDKKIGLAAVDYQFEPQHHGGSQIFAKTHLNLLTMTYTELPYQWLPPHWFAVERIFHSGWLRYLAVQWHLQDLTTKGCLITVHFHYVSRYPFLPLKRSAQYLLKKMLAWFTRIDATVLEQQQLGFEAFFERNSILDKQIAQLTQTWQYLTPNSKIPQQVAEFIYTAPDKYVYQLRPFEVADYFQLSRLDVLTFCLLATKAGFLDLNWNVLCPSCRGAPSRTQRLWQLDTQVHCDTCNIHYDAQFDHNVEVTFTPRTNIRQLDTQHYCIAGPASTAHIWAQICLDPSETRHLTLDLPVGKYRWWSLSLDDEIIVQVTKESGLPTLQLYLDQRFAQLPNIQLAESTQLTLHNPTEHWITLKIEKLHYFTRVATAALVTSLQDFRDLFSSAEVLRPNQHLGISNIVILFSDLVGSTQLYENKGDANAFRLVQEHFDVMIPIIRHHQGGVVKTIGDAVMAVFTESAAACQASLAILQAFAQRNAQYPPADQIIIKLGLHKGPCIVLNLNDRLDYFGNTVNRAARIQGLSQGNDIVMSATLFQEIQPLLVHYPALQTVSFMAELKGIKNISNLYRLWLV
jgi:adenylate cyclase